MNTHRINILHTRSFRWLLLGVELFLVTVMASAKDKKKIVVACDWDFAPYEFINAQGQHDGFDLQVLSTVFEALEMPYEFVMTSRRTGVDAFHNHEADIIVDFRARYTSNDYVRSLNVLGYYQLMAAHRPNLPDVNTIEQLKQVKTVVVNGVNDSIARLLLGPIADELTVENHTPREALASIDNGSDWYFLIGEEPLKWKIKEYNLANIVSNTMNGMVNEIHVVGYDKRLIEEIDNELTRIQQNGTFARIRDHWFHPEMKEKSTSPIVIYTGLVILLAAIFFYSVYRLALSRVKASMIKNQESEAMMHQALSMGHYSVFVSNLLTGQTHNQHGHVLKDDGSTFEQILERIHPDDRAAIMADYDEQQKSSSQAQPFSIRWNKGTKENPDWVNVKGFTFIETDEHRRPANMVITARDVTEELKAEQKERELATRYQRMFESTLVAMSFYGKDGKPIDLNERMKELSGYTADNAYLFYNTPIYDLDMLKDDFAPDSHEIFHACQHISYPELGVDKYIEMRVRPTLDNDGELLYYIITARDITSERAMYVELKRQDQALKRATETNNHYEKEMHDLLINCNMFIWHVDLKTGIIRFSRSLDGKEYTETLDEYVNSMFEDERQQVLEYIKNIRDFKRTFNMVHHFHYTPFSDTPEWFAVSGMPQTDEHGELIGLFGVVRNVSELMDAQQRLKEETARAENSGMQKSAFLANMTHEIRTPLNAIVGFSDLLQMVDDTEQRQEFIRIIRNNCDMLLRLINDIFETSTMDIKPLEIKPEEVDFAQQFSVVCQSLAQRVQEPGVEFIVDAPFRSLVTLIDMGRMQQVITNFVTNAVKYTHQGHIKVGYAYQQGPDTQQEGIYMYCEDTGSGIPKDKQKSVFERFVKLNDFVQGTGLGLSICKSIATRSGGQIGVDSEGENQGSRFWIWVPCPKIKSET